MRSILSSAARNISWLDVGIEDSRPFSSSRTTGSRRAAASLWRPNTYAMPQQTRHIDHTWIFQQDVPGTQACAKSQRGFASLNMNSLIVRRPPL